MAWKLATAYVEIVGELSRFKRDLMTAQQRIKRFGAAAARIAFGTAAAMAAIIIPVMRVVREYARFERQLSMVSTMLDEQGMRLLPAYRRQIRTLSKELGEATDTLAKGLYDILSASIAPEEALRVLTITSRAAKAGFSDTATATDAVTSILNAYGLEAREATRISDILFATVKRGKLTFGELAGSIGTVAATANMAGLSFEETAAFIATATRAGIRAHEAVTSLNAVLRAFLSPTTEAKKKAKELGFELSANTLRTRGLVGVMKQLTNAQAEELAIIFPRIRGLKGVAAALADISGLTKDVQLMHDSAGASMEAFGKVARDTQTEIDKMTASWNAFKVSFGEDLAPYVKDILTALQELFGLGELPGIRVVELQTRLKEIQKALEPGELIRREGYWFGWETPALKKRRAALRKERNEIFAELREMLQKETKAYADFYEEDAWAREKHLGEIMSAGEVAFEHETKLARDRMLLNGQTLKEMTAEAKRYTEMWMDEGMKRYLSDAEIMKRYKKDIEDAFEPARALLGGIEATQVMMTGVRAAQAKGGFGRMPGRIAVAKVEDVKMQQAVGKVEKAVKALPEEIAGEIGKLPGGARWGE